MLGIVCAMECEAAPFLQQAERLRQTAEDLYTGSLYGREFTLAVSGIGKVRAALASQYLVSRCGARHLLNCGLAGSLTPALPLFRLALVTEAAEYDMDLSAVNGTPPGVPDGETQAYFPCPGAARSPLLARYPAARLATGDRFTNAEADTALVRDVLRADLRDMEGAAVAACGRANRVDVTMVKCVSDLVGADCGAQYAENKQRAAAALSAAVKDIIGGIPRE